MISSHRPTAAELMLQARRTLDQRIGGSPPPGDSQDPVERAAASLHHIVPALASHDLGPAPDHFRKPPYGTPAYALALRAGWISGDDERADRTRYEARRLRSLRSSWRPSLQERPRYTPPKDCGTFVPALAARLDDDRNISDGARRCARKIAEVTYRQGQRDERCVQITVTYLMKALGKCRRSVQRYLRQLEAEGYIRADVVRGSRSRMCCGLIIHLLMPLFPRHHKQRWPEKRGKPGATELSLNYFKKHSKDGKSHLVPRRLWALWCADGVFRSLTTTLSPFPAIPAPLS